MIDFELVESKFSGEFTFLAAKVRKHALQRISLYLIFEMLKDIYSE